MHPATFALVMAAAAALVWMNLRVHELKLSLIKAAPPELDPITRYLFFRGWPLSPFEVCAFHGMKFHPEESPVQFALVLDFAVAGLVLFGVAVLSEWLIRRIGIQVRVSGPNKQL
jgi:hypothetical protein